ncbi:hypothetical protein GJ744_007426 [Endocarpon pusillum]|uniref:Uncharacterized protein n=1 Tax=Endocarpon pusillum TaxID=364733 RepID=A0A8H7DY71_9EURO|nr:hypothetical protein GJ744_007426 [Endocarpon pusillum]
MNIQRKWIELLNEIAEAPNEELQSCPSELLRGVQHKLCAISIPDDGQENIAALGAYKQAACTCNKGAAPAYTRRSG